MTMTSTTATAPDNTTFRIIGRKRCFPSKSQRTFRIASAVTFSASYLFVVAVAFQQNRLHFNHHNHCHSQSQCSNSHYSRFSTASRVMTDPNNLGVKIEKNTVKLSDRAALEELYILSSLAEIAKNSTTMDITTKQTKTTLRKRRSLPGQVIVKSTSTNAARGAAVSGKKKKLSSPTMFSNTNTNTNTNSGSNTNKASVLKKEKRIFFTDNTDSTTFEEDKQQTQPQKIKQQQPITPSVTNIQKFKGLSIGPPNQRNRKKKSLNNSNDSLIINTKNFIPPSSGSGIGVTENNDDDEYIRNILRKKEESFIHDEKTTERQQQLSVSLPSSIVEEEDEEDEEEKDILASTTNTYTKSSSKFTSHSSTMPGFIERTNTNKLKAYRDGIKIAEQQSGEKVVDTAAAKKKRTQINGKEMYKSSVSVPDSLIQFANEIHEVDRITPKEEIDLGEKTQEAIRLQNIYDRLVANLHREPTDDEWCAAAGKFNMESISQTIEEGLEAKNILVTSNLRMVQGVVNVYIRNGLQGQYNAGDLMQEGILALIRAAEKFDPNRGFRFSTYAMYWIRSAIKRDQLSQSRVIPVPQRLHEKHKRMNIIRKDLKESLNRPPTMAELSNAVGMSEVQIERCEDAISQKFYSLDQKMVNRMKPNNIGDNADSMHSIIESKTDENELSQDQKFLREDLLKALHSHLSEVEARMIMLRFGMDTEQSTTKRGGRTISEVSDLVGLKPDKVRRTINRSLKQLQVLVGDDFKYYNRDLNL